MVTTGNKNVTIVTISYLTLISLSKKEVLINSENLLLQSPNRYYSVKTGLRVLTENLSSTIISRKVTGTLEDWKVGYVSLSNSLIFQSYY